MKSSKKKQKRMLIKYERLHLHLVSQNKRHEKRKQDFTKKTPQILTKRSEERRKKTKEEDERRKFQNLLSSKALRFLKKSQIKTQSGMMSATNAKRRATSSAVSLVLM